MKKRIFGLVFLIFVCVCYKAQTDSVYYGNTAKDTTHKTRRQKDAAWREKLTYGGNMQLYFGQTYSIIHLSPAIGYMITDELNAGLGFIYNYSSVNYRGYGRFAQSAIGPYCYARYYFLESFFAQGQFEYLQQTNIYNIQDPKQKVWVDYIWLGGGYRRSVGDNVMLMTSIMVNIKPNKLSIYPNPIFQFGIVAGF